MTQRENFVKGLFKENPLFISVLGMCPSLATTKTLENAIGMGIAVLFVLTLSNLIISLLMSNKKIAELVKPVRIPVYIVVIATLVTIVEMLTHAFVPVLYQSLGVFIPLIVVNCIILGRAEAFASNHKPLDAVVDGVGMALGYMGGLMLLALVRESLGYGSLTVLNQFGVTIKLNLVPVLNFLGIAPMEFFVQPAGAFLTFGFLLAAIVVFSNKKAEKAKKGSEAA
ncbi:MAG: electron transport complex subunit RsxE [Candidatus Izemoplasmatales bacterium]|nr:electron transport complex subunit RsxE [Candidatus Izemoplasmatales bacterium]